jgi:HK97 family phage major capsid protein
VTPEQIRAAIVEHAKAAKAIAQRAEDESRDFTEGERGEIADHMTKCSTLREQLKAAQATGMAKAADAKLRADLAALDGVDLGDGDDPAPQMGALYLPKRGKSLGGLFVESAEYLDVLKSAGPGGGFSRGQVIQSKHARFKTLITGGSDTSAGAFVVNDNIGLQAGLDQFQRPLNVRQLLTNGTTASDTVEYVQITSTTNNASTVAESTTTATPGSQTAANGVKQESAMALAKKTAVVRTFAHWIPATTRALSDAGQIRALIDAFLLYGLSEEIEDQIMNGDGAGENFDGITHVTGTQAQNWDTDILTTTRKARTKVRTVGRSVPTAYVMHPTTWEQIDLLQDNEARYFFGGPARLGSPTLWGLPVVESETVDVAQVIVGDFRKAVLWDREQASIAVSNQHSDFFIRNMVAILAEERHAFGVIQPNAFVIADVTA